MNNPLGVSPSKGKQGTTLYTLELILCCTVFVFPVLRGTTFLPRVVATLELILCCTVFVFPVLRGTTFLPRVVASCGCLVWLPRVLPCFPLLGLTPSGLFMGLSSI